MHHRAARVRRAGQGDGDGRPAGRLAITLEEGAGEPWFWRQEAEALGAALAAMGRDWVDVSVKRVAGEEGQGAGEQWAEGGAQGGAQAGPQGGPQVEGVGAAQGGVENGDQAMDQGGVEGEGGAQGAAQAGGEGGAQGGVENGDQAMD